MKKEDLIFQIVWCERGEEGGHKIPTLAPQDETEFLTTTELNTKIKFLRERRYFDYEQLEYYFMVNEGKKPKNWEGGYYKHKVAVFDKETKELLFTFRYDLFSEGERLDQAMGYIYTGGGFVKNNFEVELK